MKNVFIIFLMLFFLIPTCFASNYIRIDKLGTWDYTFPIYDGNTNQVLATNGSGELIWIDMNESPGSDYWIPTSEGIEYTDGNVGIINTLNTSNICLNTYVCITYEDNNIYIG